MSNRIVGTPGEALYESVMVGASIARWGALTVDSKQVWEKRAEVFLKAFGQPVVEKLPDNYIDMQPVKIETIPDLTNRTTRVLIELQVADAIRYSNSPGSTAPKLQAFQKGVASGKYMCRVGLFTNAEIESQFNRMDSDGTVRELLPEEGSW